MKEIIRTIFIGITILVLTTAFSSSKKNASSDLSRHSPVPNELYNEIAYMDSVIFEAFNTHDLEKLKTIFSENLEFYHDKDGLAGYEQTINNLRSLFEKNKNTGLRRDLVKGSLEVYPIKDYGAVEICLHRFCHVENGKDDCGVFKNIMVWQKNNGIWKVTRVISYDH